MKFHFNYFQDNYLKINNFLIVQMRFTIYNFKDENFYQNQMFSFNRRCFQLNQLKKFYFKSVNQKETQNMQFDYESLSKNTLQRTSMITFPHFQKQTYREKKQKISRTQAITNIIAYSEKNNNLIDQYNEDFFVSYFDRQTIEELAKAIPSNLQMKMEDFIKKLTSFINHNHDETLFLIISLINVYKKIKDETKSQNGIRISDFTSHICQKISNLGAQLLIPLKEIACQKVKPDPLRIRSIDLEPPVIFSEVEKQVPQISKLKQKKDKKVDPLKPLSQFFFSLQNSVILTLGSLSSTIGIYSMEFEKKKEIYPSCFKMLDKKLAILSFAFSEKQQRIGAIINNMGLAFWDFSDQFRTEKLIQKTNIGTKIFYLELNDEWVTANDENVIYWDLKEESIKTMIKEEKSKTINSICEISHIRAIGVAYTMKDDSKWVIIYQPCRRQGPSRGGLKKNELDSSEIEFKRLARVNLSPSGCHTLYYNRFTQIIIPLGYKDTIPLYSIDSQSLDISLLHQLKGHQTIVTSITQIDQSDIIFTGDDRGNVIVWTLTDMRCQQSIRVANWIGSLKCFGNMLYYGDARINKIQLEGMKVKKENTGSKSIHQTQQFSGIFKSYRSERNQLYIFTRKACRIISMINGKTLKIVELCAQDEEILVVENYFNGFILGTSKGDIHHYGIDFQSKWKLNSVHDSDTTQLKVDKANKFFLSNGRDSNIYIWSQKTLQQEGPRKTLFNGQGNVKEEISFTELSQRFGLFITSSYTNQVRVWDYESCRLIHVLEIHYEKDVYPVAIKLCEKKPLLIVACSNEVVLVYKFSRKDAILQFKLIAKIDKKVLSISSRSDKKKITAAIIMGMPTKNGQVYKNSGFQSQQSRYSLSNTQHKILLEAQQSISTLKFAQNNSNDIKPHPSFLVEQILLDLTGNDYKLILAYNKGSIIHLSLSMIVADNFESFKEESFDKSANVQRPIKESFIKQIYRSQVDRTIFEKKRLNYVFSLEQKQVVWNNKFHKDSVTHLDIFESEYISTLCNDGYYKLISVYTGSNICSLNINYPLPIRWDYVPHKNHLFCEKIHQALILLDDIFSDVSQLTKIQFDAMDVRPFLDQVCRPKIRAVKQKTLILKSLIQENGIQKEKQNTSTNKKEKQSNEKSFFQKQKQAKISFIKPKPKKASQSFKVEVLSDQFTPEDLKCSTLHYPSLKSYEVYKRVKKFINIKDNQNELAILQNKSLEMNHKKTQVQQRDVITDLFSPNYLPKLLNKDLQNNCKQKLILDEKSKTSNQISLTKDDFCKFHEIGNSNSFSIQKQNSIQRALKPVSTKKLQLQKLSSQMIEQKMQWTGFEFGSKNYSSQSILTSLNGSEADKKMSSTNATLKTSKASLMEELCLKTHEFKKLHKIVKI